MVMLWDNDDLIGGIEIRIVGIVLIVHDGYLKSLLSFSSDDLNNNNNNDGQCKECKR